VAELPVVEQAPTVSDVQRIVRDSRRIAIRGAGTKTALGSNPGAAVLLDMAGLSGVIEYDPSEFTFTALAGTRLSDVSRLLAEHGQFLPFDPLLAARGATLGGSLASGLSGPGRYRYGGLRDFILAVRWVDGAGQLVAAGGKVVKNAAGFDLPKLMVGSLGQYGALVELTFKVFPRPEAWLTLTAAYAGLAASLEAQQRLYTAPLDIEALDLVPGADGSFSVWVRLGGLGSVLAARAERVRALLAGADDCAIDLVEGEAEAAMWHAVREFDWVPAGWSLAKVPLAPGAIAGLEDALAGAPAVRRYSAGGNLAWLALPESPARLLESLGRAGLLVLGPPAAQPLIGLRPGAEVERRVKVALDPDGKFASA
jgi:glycolate oxidase FAD binding subunit